MSIIEDESKDLNLIIKRTSSVFENGSSISQPNNNDLIDKWKNLLKIIKWILFDIK